MMLIRALDQRTEGMTAKYIETHQGPQLQINGKTVAKGREACDAYAKANKVVVLYKAYAKDGLERWVSIPGRD
jgi:hypothetical protein